MFQISNKGRFGNAISVDIRGCPPNGMGAVDFRRQAGLPDGTSDEISLGSHTFCDEAIARTLPLDGNADFWFYEALHTSGGALNDIKHGFFQKGSGFNTVDAALIKSFIDAPSAAGIAAIYRDMFANHAAAKALWEQDQESKRAQEEQRKQAELDRKTAMAAARELLADELTVKAEAIKDRRVLAEFLANFPDDALRGVCKKIAANRAGTTADEIEKKIEAASPVTIFGDDAGDE